MKNIKGFESFEDQESVEQKSNEAKKWIQDAIKRPGSLRRRLKKEKGEKSLSLLPALLWGVYFNIL